MTIYACNLQFALVKQKAGTPDFVGIPALFLLFVITELEGFEPTNKVLIRLLFTAFHFSVTIFVTRKRQIDHAEIIPFITDYVNGFRFPSKISCRPHMQ